MSIITFCIFEYKNIIDIADTKNTIPGAHDDLNFFMLARLGGGGGIRPPITNHFTRFLAKC